MNEKLQRTPDSELKSSNEKNRYPTQWGVRQNNDRGCRCALSGMIWYAEYDAGGILENQLQAIPRRYKS
jgi:hypothetical protein